MENNKFAISVLIRTLGNTNMLSEALASLRQQSFKEFETVIIEDGPATLEAFLDGYKDLSIHYEATGSKMGRSRAGNRALAVAQGEWLIFLDDDDFFYPDHLAELLALAKSGGCCAVYSWSEQRSIERVADGRVAKTGLLKRIRRESFSTLHLADSNYIPINAVLFHRSLYQKAGGFDEDLEYLEDWFLWLRYTAMTGKWPCTRKVSVVYNVSLNKKSYRERRMVLRSHIAHIDQMLANRTPFSRLASLRHDMSRAEYIWINLRKVFYRLTGYSF